MEAIQYYNHNKKLQKGFFNNCQKYTANPLTPMSDQNRVSPYNTNKISTK